MHSALYSGERGSKEKYLTQVEIGVSSESELSCVGKKKEPKVYFTF